MGLTKKQVLERLPTRQEAIQTAKVIYGDDHRNLYKILAFADGVEHAAVKIVQRKNGIKVKNE